MPHIHTEPGQHDATAGALIIRTDGDEPRALLHMHRKHGKLLQVGGHIELDETPWQAISHELAEESGYSIDELTLLQPKQRIENLPSARMHPYPVVMNTHVISPEHSHSETVYVFIAAGEPSGVIDGGESPDLRWLTQAELNALTDAEVYPDVIVMYNFVFDVCLPEWEQVPTATFAL